MQRQDDTISSLPHINPPLIYFQLIIIVTSCIYLHSATYQPSYTNPLSPTKSPFAAISYDYFNCSIAIMSTITLAVQRDYYKTL